MSAITKQVLLGAVAALAASPAARGADIYYTLRFDGVDLAEVGALAPGNYTLEVWGEVRNNDLGGGFTGGILQYAVQLDEFGGVIEFVEGVSGPPFNPVPSGTWDSETAAPADFVNSFRGVLNAAGHDVFAETGGANPGAYDNLFDSYGAGGPSLLTSGPIVYSGGYFELEVSGLTQDQVIYGPNFSGESPDHVYGYRIDSWGIGTVIFPEPSALLLVAVSGSVLVANGCCGRGRCR